jgi:hypothetical protein
MKTNKIIYWISTAFLSLFMLFSAYSYLTNPDMKAAFVHLGFPGYFRVELAMAKILGSLALLVPMIPALIKQFAYAGFTITFVSAFVAHTSSGDPMSVAIMPVIALAILAVSYLFYRKTQLKTALS